MKSKYEEECFGTPKKRYGKTRKGIVVDGFDEEAIRRRIHRMYDNKEQVTLERLLVGHTCCLYHFKVIYFFPAGIKNGWFI